MPTRLYSLVSPDGDVLVHWRCTDSIQAHRFAAMNHPLPGDRLVGPQGETLATFNQNGEVR